MHYFEEIMLPEERGMIPYLPTTNAFLTFIDTHYHDRIALMDATRQETYRELTELAGIHRQTLYAFDVKPGDRVGLLDQNSLEAVEWFLAITSYGATVVMLPGTLSADALARSSAHFELACLVAGEKQLDKTLALDIPVIPATELADVAYPMGACDKATTAAIFLTGGTTGTPKGVILSHGALMRGCMNGTYREGTLFGQSFVAALPFTHVFGLVFSLMAPLYTGSLVGVCPEMRALFSMMALVHPTTMIAVPGMAEIMLGMARMRGIESLGGNLKLIISGAAPMPPRIVEGFADFGIQVLCGYGLTETANLVCANFHTREMPESVGLQYPHQTMRIQDGELQVKGDMLFDGYWKDEDATRRAFTEDGYFRTGDLARQDAAGNITITGRMKNLIILSNGENVSPEEVEAFFYRLPLVKDCLVYEDLVQGNAVIALEVQPIPGVTDEQLEEAIRTESLALPSMMRPAKVVVRHEDFARTASLKIARNGRMDAKP